MIIAGTGHRPDKLGGYGLSQHTRLRAFAKSELKRSNPNRVISGMAAGWDLALADAAFILDIPFTAAVPFEGHDAMWNYDYRAIYLDLLSKAAFVHIVSSGGYEPAKMQSRNRWMVDHCTCVLALWNGDPSGTANCVRYAEESGKPVENVWGRWVQFQE